MGTLGPLEERKALNSIDADVVLNATQLVREGRVFSLAQPLRAQSVLSATSASRCLKAWCLLHCGASHRRILFLCWRRYPVLVAPPAPSVRSRWFIWVANGLADRPIEPFAPEQRVDVAEFGNVDRFADKLRLLLQSDPLFIER